MGAEEIGMSVNPDVDAAATQPVPFQFSDLAKFKKSGLFPEGYPANVARFFAPDDNVHEAIMTVLRSARVSIAVAMFGYDSDEIDEYLREAWEKEGLPVQICLDKTQAGGAHEKAILAKWPQDQIGNRIVIGQSRLHAISHMKEFVIDGMYTIGGSTNLGPGGETKQNNELVIVKDAIYAAEARAKIDMIHDEMVKQMAKTA